MKYDFYTELFAKENCGFTPYAREMSPFIDHIGLMPGSVNIVAKGKAFALTPESTITIYENPCLCDDCGEELVETITVFNTEGLYYVTKKSRSKEFGYGYYDSTACDAIKNVIGSFELSDFPRIGIIPDREGIGNMDDLFGLNMVEFIESQKNLERMREQ